MAHVNQGIRINEFNVTIDLTPEEYKFVVKALQTEAAIADAYDVTAVEKLRDELEQANIFERY